jgi:NAD(P)-dependent dehydrogenase (short-subunit alcohol dehydrogenase family)
MSTQPRIALVTGASRGGLGRNTALHLAEKGVDLLITYRSNAAEAESVVTAAKEFGRSAVALQLDTGDVRSFDGFVADVRRKLKQTWDRASFDFLVNNAGIGIYAAFADTTEDAFDQLTNVQFKGVYFLTQNLLPVLADGGRIVNVSSGLTRFTIEGYSAYASVKGAVEVLTHDMAKELGPRRITVNTVAPGPVETDFTGGIVRDDEQVNGFLAAQTALGRVGLPDDIGGAISALLSEDTEWINGQRIEASGGAFL